MKHDDDVHLEYASTDRIFSLTRPDEKLLTLYIIYSVMANIAFLITFLPLYFRYKTLRYRFDEEGVAVSYGLLWRKETYLTYTRIQDIHVTRNIFERWLGIGTVVIQTASGDSAAGVSIWGITSYTEVRNFLYARMRGYQLKSDKVPHLPGSNSVDQVLRDIRDELKAIHRLMEDQANV